MRALEDQHRFLLHHAVMWEGGDTHFATRLAGETRPWYPELVACSFDCGFHSSENRVRLDARQNDGRCEIMRKSPGPEFSVRR